MRILLILVSAMMLNACGHTVKIRKTEKPPMDPVAAEKVWGDVLKAYVNERGQVDFENLLDNRKDLDRYVEYVSVKKLDDFKTPDDRLAHLINAYNALSMHMVLEKGIPPDNDGFFKRLNFFYMPEYLVGGEEMSLYTLENEYVRKVGDERVHFALNCMAVSCPRLPQQPFNGKKLQAQLTASAKEFFAQPSNLLVNEDEQTVYISEILKFFTEDFVPAKSPSLNEYVTKWSDLKVPTDFDVEFFDYNWTINSSNNAKIFQSAMD